MVKGTASAGVSGTPRVLIILSPCIVGAGPEDEEVNRMWTFQIWAAAGANNCSYKLQDNFSDGGLNIYNI